MKKRLLIAGLLFLIVYPAISGARPGEEEKTTPWYGPYEDAVYYRYIKTRLANGNWPKDYDLYEFENRSARRVSVTWDMSSGTHNMLDIGPNAKGARTALAPGERIRSISVKVP